MILKLLALFTIIPLVELALLIPLGQEIGLAATLALVIGTAILGAILGKLEGARAWKNIQDDLNSGRMPADSILDGLAVLIAGIFLVTPGVLTDIVAILLLIPPARAPFKAIAKKRFKKAMADDGGFGFMAGPGFGPPPNMGPDARGDGASPFSSTSPFSQGSDDDIIDVHSATTEPDDSPSDDTSDDTSDDPVSQDEQRAPDEESSPQRIHYLD